MSVCAMSGRRGLSEAQDSYEADARPDARERAQPNAPGINGQGRGEDEGGCKKQACDRLSWFCLRGSARG